jgi:hypothetical protein
MGYGMDDGMKLLKSTYRTTFALDEVARSRIQRLSKKWQVSQAEVIRRSLEKAEAMEHAIEPDPLAMLESLASKGELMSKEDANAYLKANQENRKEWRSER